MNWVSSLTGSSSIISAFKNDFWKLLAGSSEKLVSSIILDTTDLHKNKVLQLLNTLERDFIVAKDRAISMAARELYSAIQEQEY